MELILLSISAVIFVSYITFIVAKYGVQPSISASYYCLPRNFNFVFTLFIGGFIFPILFVATTGLLIFAGAFIMVIGAAQDFLNDTQRKVHYYSAAAGITLGMASMIIDYHIWIIPAASIFLSALVFFLKLKNTTWWIEHLVFIGILSSLFVHYLK